MKMLRNGAAAAAVATLMVFSAPAAHAATTTVVVTPADLKGWAVDSPNPPFGFVVGPHTSGIGSLQFDAIPASPAASKMFVKHPENIVTDTFGGISFDYYIDPAAANVNPQQYYLNVYVDSAADGTPPANFYECRYDYVPASGTTGWNTLTITRDTVATNVAIRENTMCGNSIGGVASGSSIFLIALNAGDTSASDAGIKGGFDTVVVSATAGSSTTYDFEPATPCNVLPTPGLLGTSGGNVILGTAAAERIDLLGGDDTADAFGGDDCVLGGDGRDVLRAGDGADEVSGGPGPDVIDGGLGADRIDPGVGRDTVLAGAGNDTVLAADGEADIVDCGAGTDTVTADRVDLLLNCENVTRTP